MFPRYLTSFVGGRNALDEVGSLLDGHRLVTLTGAGGCGKTRLAVEAASRRQGDRCFVDLAPLTSDGVVINAVAASVGVGEPGAKPIADALPDTLGDRDVLIVLDNCEHVIDACADTANLLLTRCPGVRVLATSREPLRVPGEVTWRVRSLPIPEAVQLFVDRSQLARPGYHLPGANHDDDEADAIHVICRRLDGIPLAVELAASRMRVLDAKQVAQGLTDRFRLLAGGPRTVPTRQQTLEASVAWSYDLLDERQRRLLRRLAVFAGHFTTAEVEEVCSDDSLPAPEVVSVLLELVDRSLIHVESDAGSYRYRLLETIRQFAGDLLTRDGEKEQLLERHLQHMGRVCDHFESVADSPKLDDAAAEMERHLDDLRQAMDWTVDASRAGDGLRLAGQIRLFWIVRSRTQEGRVWLDRLLAAAPDADTAPALVAGAHLALFALDPFRQRDLAEAAITAARTAGDRKSEGRGLVMAGWAAVFADPPAASPLFTEALTVVGETGDEPFQEFGSFGAGIAAVNGAGDLTSARELLHHGMAIARRRKTFGLRFGLAGLGYVDALRGELASAIPSLQEAVELPIGQFDRWTRELAMQWLGLALTYRGDYDAAQEVFEEALSSARSVGNVPVFTLLHFGLLQYAVGSVDDASALVTEALPILQALGLEWLTTQSLRILGDARAHAGEQDAARDRWDAAATVATATNHPLALTIASIGQARACLVDSDTDGALALSRKALRSAVGAGFGIGIADALDQLVIASIAAGDHETPAALIPAVENERTRMGYARFPAEQPEWDEARRSIEPAPLADGSLGSALAAAFKEDRPARPQAGWASLTPTELRVARLVAQGLTNPQIGERMFISRRTVQAHLSHVFSKLGMSNRAELAAEMSRFDSAE